MPLPRIQSVEFHEHHRTPLALRETVVETLSRALAWGRMMDRLVDPFAAFVQASGCEEVLDLCAGAGGPAGILVDAFVRRGQTPPRFMLTDLLPQPEAWARPVRTRPESLAVVDTPVDATCIPAELTAGRARVIINAMHHFPPSIAQAVFADAVQQRSPIFISEAFTRNPLLFANFAPAGLLSLFLNPLLAHTRRWQKAAWTYLTPIPVLMSLWDGVVSTLRSYSERELRAMVEPLSPSYQWTFGWYRYPPLGRGYYFYGVPLQEHG